MGWREEFAEKQRAKADRIRSEIAMKETLKNAQKVGKVPWWESDRDAIMVEYPNVEAVDRELALASPLGWYIADTDGDGGHINLGRTATGAVLTGGFSLLFGGSRSKGKTTINWRRENKEPIVSAKDDPVALIQSLAGLRDSGVLTEEEFAAKKSEILSRT